MSHLRITTKQPTYCEDQQRKKERGEGNVVRMVGVSPLK